MTGLIPDTQLKNTFWSLPENTKFSEERFCVIFRDTLSKYSFSNCHFENCSFRKVTLDQCSFKHCTFTNCIFEDTTFINVSLNNTLFEISTFSRVSFQDTTLTLSFNRTGNEFYHCTGIVPISNIGEFTRTIYAYSGPRGPIVNIGCFTGTKRQALARIRSKYNEPSRKIICTAYCLAVKAAFAVLATH